MPKYIFKNCDEDNIKIHPHCNSPYCSQRIIEVNPVIGCSFQCQYCCLYTQAEENHFSHITVYQDYPELLEKYINNNIQKIHDYNFFLSFESDCLQEIFIEEGILKKILVILKNFKAKYFLLTKGALNNRDILELLIETKDYCQVVINDTMPNDKLQKLLEPNAATIEERFESARYCLNKDIFTTISFSPILPFLGLDYLKEKIIAYIDMGIEHFRFDMLELSIESYRKIVALLPEYEKDMEKYFLSENTVENLWNMPNSQLILKRYKPSHKVMADIYLELQSFISSFNPNVTASICDATVAQNTLLTNFNQRSYFRGINCMGVKVF